MVTKADPFPEWQRLTVLAVAGIILVFSLFSIYSAAVHWTSLPSNPVVVLYFLIVLVVVPVFAAWAFLLAWERRSPGQAMILTAIPAAILLLRAWFIGGF